MKKLIISRLLPLLILIITITVAYLFIRSVPHGNIKRNTFSKLEKIRHKKKHQIIEYFTQIRKLSEKIAYDTVMTDFFNTMKERQAPPDHNTVFKIDTHFVRRYGNFYDILFVDETGYVFYSIKQEADYRTNLFTGTLARTKLAQTLKNANKATFVGYDHYYPSDEPAAFYIVPVYNHGIHNGWFIMQCSINRVNTMLTERKKLGRTGEIYLVNTNKLMLSESRFMEDCTILQMKVDTRAVKDALENTHGEDLIDDYRGIKVYSSYEKFDIFGITWIIITEIDENEVITEYYRKHEKYFIKKICNYLEKQKPEKQTIPPHKSPSKRIDINEFAKVTPGDYLQTYGVAECTALTICYPERFAYMAHIAPTDEIYVSGILSKLFLGSRTSDFTNELIKKITYYDIYRYELDRLQFSIIASHTNSIKKVVHKILDHNIELSDITFIYNPAAYGANVLLDPRTNTTTVEWYTNNTTHLEQSFNYEDLGTIIKKIINYTT